MFFFTAIASNGETYIEPLNQHLNMANFTELLEQRFVPWIQHNFPDEGWRVLMDNCPAHRGHIARNWMDQNHPGFFGYTPPKSPDANIIEKCYAVAKNNMHRALVPNNHEGIIQHFTESWNVSVAQNPDMIQSLYDSFPHRINEMILREGWWTSYM